MDFNRTRLGVTLPVKPEHVDLAQVLGDEMEQVRAAYPKRRIELAVTGDTRGEWDRVRLQQVLRNLVANAARYGTADTPLHVALRGEAERVTLEVENKGPTIDADALSHIFEPLKRGPHYGSPNYRAGLGLGLFILREIVRAHGGEVSARSDAGQTTFTVHLPRKPPG
jgi:signal transduction histidine kinase